MGRWPRYWFAEGGRVSIAVLRIAIAIAVMMSLSRLHANWSAGLPGSGTPQGVYHPIGIWMLVPGPPPSAVVAALWLIAWAAAILMLLGAATRASTAVTFVAGVALAALSYSGSRSWSHSYNVVFVALLAFLGARGGDVLSVDAWIRSLRKRPPIDVARGYQWSIRLVQVAVVAMFASGMLHKLIAGHMTLRWALSDNMRHQLLMRYDLSGLHRPAIVDWLLEDVWRYRTAAMLNLVSQLTPVAACFLMRRPLLRALAGTFFIVETIALAVVMQLWNPQWLPLAVVFVDWEALLARFGRPVAAATAPADWRPRRATLVFITAFFVYEMVISAIPTLDQRVNTYPFTSFPMFAVIRARAPYDDHLPYSVPGVHFEVDSDRPLSPALIQHLDFNGRAIVDVRDPDELRKRLATIFGTLRAHHRGIHALRAYLTIFETAAYPAPAQFEPHAIAILGEYDGTSFRTALGTTRDVQGQLVVTPGDGGVDLTGAQLVYYRDNLPEPHELAAGPGPWALAPIDGDPLDFVAIAGGKPWLIDTFSPDL